MIKKVSKKSEKKDALFAYIGKCREEKKVETSCQWKGGKNEKFCRATSQNDCKGCKFYTMGVWEFYEKCYDVIRAREEEIQKLQKENEDLRNGITFRRVQK